MAISIYKGNNLDVNFQIRNQDDEIEDLTGADIYFTVKVEEGIEGEVVIEKNIVDGVSSGITITDAGNGFCQVSILPSDTQNLVPKKYMYEILVELPDGMGGFKRYTAEIDELEVKKILINRE